MVITMMAPYQSANSSLRIASTSSQVHVHRRPRGRLSHGLAPTALDHRLLRWPHDTLHPLPQADLGPEEPRGGGRHRTVTAGRCPCRRSGEAATAPLMLLQLLLLFLLLLLGAPLQLLALLYTAIKRIASRQHQFGYFTPDGSSA